MTEERERFRNLLVLLLEAMMGPDGIAQLDGNQLREIAIAAGFDARDAAEIVAWLAESGYAGGVTASTTTYDGGEASDGARILTDAERAFIDPEAFGYLLGLGHTGQITAGQREYILHLVSDAAIEPLGIDDVDEILDQVLQQRVEEQGSILPPSNSGLRH